MATKEVTPSKLVLTSSPQPTDTMPCTPGVLELRKERRHEILESLSGCLRDKTIDGFSVVPGQQGLSDVFHIVRNKFEPNRSATPVLEQETTSMPVHSNSEVGAGQPNFDAEEDAKIANACLEIAELTAQPLNDVPPEYRYLTQGQVPETVLCQERQTEVYKKIAGLATELLEGRQVSEQAKVNLEGMLIEGFNDYFQSDDTAIAYKEGLTIGPAEREMLLSGAKRVAQDFLDDRNERRRERGQTELERSIPDDPVEIAKILHRIAGKRQPYSKTEDGTYETWRISRSDP